MKKINSLVLAVAIALGTCSLLTTTGCKTSQEQIVYSTLSVQDAAADQAIEQWNLWLGAQRTLIQQDYGRAETLVPGSPERAAAIKAGNDRQAKWQAVEEEVIIAVADYNKAIDQARIAVVAYYDAKSRLGRVEGADAQFDTAKAKLDAARAIVGIAAQAVVRIVSAYVPIEPTTN